MQGFSIAILCGGRSSRFGQDKTLAKVSGMPLLRHIYQSVRKLSDDIFLITKWKDPGKYQFLDVPVVYEPYKDYAPLYGIEQALVHAKHQWILILAADMPNLSHEVFEGLLESRNSASKMVIPKTDRLHPLCALYSKDCLKEVRDRIQNENLKLQDLSSMPGCKIIAFEDESPFININTQEDLKKALKSLSGTKPL